MICTSVLDKNLQTFDTPTSYSVKCGSIFQSTETNRIMSCEDDLYIKSYVDKKKHLVSYKDEEFVEVARNKWLDVNEEKAKVVSEKVADEINRLWKFKCEDILLYPQFYKNCGNISLVVDHHNSLDINFEKISVLKNNIGQPSIKVPNYSEKEQNKIILLPTTFLKGKSTNRIPPVSRDQTALDLAREKEVKVVISHSGLKTLVDNHNNNPVSDWTLPFSVKEVHCEDGSKKIVLFVDKALPHSSMSNVQQKNWHGKKAVNSFVSENRMAFSELSLEDFQLFQNAECSLEKGIEVAKKRPNKNTSSKCLSPSKKNQITEKSNLVRTFYSYELWTLEELGEKKNLMKNATKNFKMVVRNKIPSTMNLRQCGHCVSSKLEYQEEFGGEILSLSQLTREWMSLCLNSGGCLVRVRADGNSLKFIGHELSDLATTEINARHFYNIQLKKQLNLVYIVFNNLINLPKGQYLLRRTCNGGLFAYIFKAGEGKENYNLYKDFSGLTVKKEKLPWTEIDLSLLSPTIRISSFNTRASLPRPEIIAKKLAKKKASKDRKKDKQNKKIETC